MRAHVFTDASLARYAGQFAWLALDTERPQNAQAMKTVKVEGLPSYFVVDPRDGKVLIRWIGGATVPQLAKVLDDAKSRFAGGESGKANELLAKADRLFADAKNAESIPLFEQAIAAAPAGWPKYSRAVESLLYAYAVTDAAEPATKLALEAWPKLRNTPSAASIASSGLAASVQLPPESELRKKAAPLFEAECRKLVTKPPKGIPGDDISAVHQALVAAREQSGDSAGARKAREEWSAFLERAAAAAKTKEERAVFDSHRLTAFIQLGTPEKAVPFLTQAAKDFPDDYNPWARLAGAYEAMKSWDEALAANDKALELVYGPRRLTVIETRIRICNGKGDPACRKGAFEELLRTAKALPDDDRKAARIAAIEKRMAEIR